MWEQTQLAIQIIQLAVFLVMILYVYNINVEYVRLKRIITHAISKLKLSLTKKMDCDALIDQLLEEDTTTKTNTPCETTPLPKTQVTDLVDKNLQEQKRTRLAAIVAGGTAQKYIGNRLTLAQLDVMSDDEISKHYSRYEARLGASMTKTLGASALQMYALAASTFLPIPPENRPQLVIDLEEDPFVGHALTTACCELYYRYGMYLAPLTAAMTTAKHCQFEDQSNLLHTKDKDECNTRPGNDIDRGNASSRDDSTRPRDDIESRESD